MSTTDFYLGLWFILLLGIAIGYLIAKMSTVAADIESVGKQSDGDSRAKDSLINTQNPSFINTIDR